MRFQAAVICLASIAIGHQSFAKSTNKSASEKHPCDYIENTLPPDANSPQLHITIHQANEGEFLEVNEYSPDSDIYTPLPEYSHLVSTGIAVGSNNDNGEYSDNITEEGTFRVTFMHLDHRSGQFGKLGPDGKVLREEGARMKYSIFFNGGKALHATDKDKYDKLGFPASHGCVRQTEEDAKKLFDLVCKYRPNNVTIFVEGSVNSNENSNVDAQTTVVNEAQPALKYDPDGNLVSEDPVTGEIVLVRENPDNFKPHKWRTKIGEDLKKIGQGFKNLFKLKEVQGSSQQGSGKKKQGQTTNWSDNYSGR